MKQEQRDVIDSFSLPIIVDEQVDSGHSTKVEQIDDLG